MNERIAKCFYLNVGFLHLLYKEKLFILFIMEKNNKIKRLYRSKNDRVIAGICGGIGKYLEIDPVLIRVIWVILIFFGGTGLLAYLIAWLLIPREPGWI